MSVTQDSKGNSEDELRSFDSLPSCLDNIRRDDVEIVLLGTGSSQPSKYRNVSSIYINLFSKGSLLLDCGEGTLSQLRRRFGLEGTVDAVRKLKCIWISHIHADHHAGLVRILALRRDLLKEMAHEPLLVIGPIQLAIFLDRYNDLEDLNMRFLDCRSTTAPSWDAFACAHMLRKCQTFSSEHMDKENREVVTPELEGSCSKRQKLSLPEEDGVNFSLLRSLEEVLKEAGLERLASFPVVHCREGEAFGVILKARERLDNAGAMKPGWKIVYSGDTRPCMEVVRASHGATLLIHEATFDDSLAEEAVARKHSTTKEAIEVGESSGAYRVILTHFSQRYPKVPSFDDINSQKTCIAFDLMSVNMADLPLLPRILPYFKLLFKNDVPENLVDSSDIN